MIILAGRYEIANPEERVRDYCRVEIYRGYDDQHSIDNTIYENDSPVLNADRTSRGPEVLMVRPTASI